MNRLKYATIWIYPQCNRPKQPRFIAVLVLGMTGQPRCDVSPLLEDRLTHRADLHYTYPALKAAPWAERIITKNGLSGRSLSDIPHKRQALPHVVLPIRPQDIAETVLKQQKPTSSSKLGEVVFFLMHRDKVSTVRIILVIGPSWCDGYILRKVIVDSTAGKYDA